VSKPETETTDPADGQADDGTPVDQAAPDQSPVDSSSVDGDGAAEDSGSDSAQPSASTAGEDSGEGSPAGEGSVEALVADLERVTGERNQYLEASQRLQAEFENYRKQVSRREADSRDRANDGLINELLPILDAFDAAVASGIDSVDPMRTTMLDALVKNGLERLDPAEAPFDPNQHEAVIHEEGGDGSGPTVTEVMRAGYVWSIPEVGPEVSSRRQPGQSQRRGTVQGSIRGLRRVERR